MLIIYFDFVTFSACLRLLSKNNLLEPVALSKKAGSNIKLYMERINCNNIHVELLRRL